MPGGGRADVGPPASAGSRSCSDRPLLLRSDVPWTPEGSAGGPVAGSVAESSGSQSTRSPYYHPLRSVSGGYSQRAIEAYEAQLRAEAIGAHEGEEECVFPQRVMDRLAVQESLSVAARRRRKRGREDETAELDDVGAVSGGWPAPHRDDDADGGGDGAGGGGSLST